MASATSPVVGDSSGSHRNFRIAAVRALLVSAASQGESARVSFGSDMLPVVERRCVTTHHGESARGGLQLVSVPSILRGGQSGPAVLAGNREASIILAKVSGEQPLMPPAGDMLSVAELAALRAWIAAGAPDDSSSRAAGPDVRCVRW